MLDLFRYGEFIPVMTLDEQRALAEGRLRPSPQLICLWCERLNRRRADIENRFSEAMEKQSAPLENRK